MFWWFSEKQTTIIKEKTIVKQEWRVIVHVIHGVDFWWVFNNAEECNARFIQILDAFSDGNKQGLTLLSEEDGVFLPRTNVSWVEFKFVEVESG